MICIVVRRREGGYVISRERALYLSIDGQFSGHARGKVRPRHWAFLAFDDVLRICLAFELQMMGPRQIASPVDSGFEDVKL